ncbi:MAG: hypothetical protein OHK005_11270 [Candidatus Methylacidiphilales bacterium]
MRAIILDGWMGNGRRFERLRRCLEGGGVEAVIWTYDNTGRRDLGIVAGELLATLMKGKGLVHLVGYSMGGLVVREALRQGPDVPIGSATFIHVPHQGTRLAHLLPLPGVRQLRPGNPFLERLAGQHWHWPTLNIWCPGDLMVVPGWRSRWEGDGRNQVCRVPAHVWPIYSDFWHQKISAFIRSVAGGVEIE